ncbi:MAG: class I SAM-dependent methyltransferase [Bryobacteraceae bacterium]|nr:class I SAM-dependent methyltransferase [Bryobacteraceae bacterium]
MTFTRPASDWIDGKIPVFAPLTPDERAASRYDRDFSVPDVYTGIAFGHRLFGSGAAEGLYRTVSALLLATPKPPEAVLDLGCGVGRVLYDCAPAWPATRFLGIDLSYNICRRASALLKSNQPVPLPGMARWGWPGMVFNGARTLDNVTIAQASALDLPCPPLSCDAVLATLLLCRLPDPVAGLAQMVRVLRPGGKLILATPCGFTTEEPWSAFVPAEKMREHLAAFGLRIDEWIEDLPYRERIDAQGNAHDWRVRVIAATCGV